MHLFTFRFNKTATGNGKDERQLPRSPARCRLLLPGDVPQLTPLQPTIIPPTSYPLFLAPHPPTAAGETSVRHAPESAMLATGRPTRTRDQAPEGPRARVDQYVLRKAVEAAKRAKLQAASARPLSSMVSTLGAQDKAGRTAADLPNSGSARPPWEEGAPMESPAHALPQPGPVPHSPTPSPGLGPRLLDEVQQARELLPSYFAKSLLRRRDTAGPVPRVPGEIMAVAGPGMDPNTGGGRGRGSGRAEAAPSTPSSSSSREPL